MGSRAKAPIKMLFFQERGLRCINHALKEGSSGVGEVKMDGNR